MELRRLAEVPGPALFVPSRIQFNLVGVGVCLALAGSTLDAFRTGVWLLINPRDGAPIIDTEKGMPTSEP